MCAALVSVRSRHAPEALVAAAAFMMAARWSTSAAPADVDDGGDLLRLRLDAPATSNPPPSQLTYGAHPGARFPSRAAPSPPLLTLLAMAMIARRWASSAVSPRRPEGSALRHTQPNRGGSEGLAPTLMVGECCHSLERPQLARCISRPICQSSSPTAAPSRVHDMSNPWGLTVEPSSALGTRSSDPIRMHGSLLCTWRLCEVHRLRRQRGRNGCGAGATGAGEGVRRVRSRQCT